MQRRLKGFQPENLDPVYNAKASCESEDPRVCDKHVLRTSDTADNGDQLGHAVKPVGKYWSKVPTDAERAIYEGLHIHSADNPMGLHTHMVGGELGGGHTHTPGNLYGTHFHGKEMKEDSMMSTDGAHVHNTSTMPTGKHQHHISNFA